MLHEADAAEKYSSEPGTGQKMRKAFLPAPP
jgi:hypothetical protein